MPGFASIFSRGETPVIDLPIREIIAIEPVDFLTNQGAATLDRQGVGAPSSRHDGEDDGLRPLILQQRSGRMYRDPSGAVPPLPLN